jgi:cleavage and polyadenylation specificity factor subunit 1
MYHYDGEVLNGCAFIDADFYIVTMSSVKNFLVVGDLCKSITLVYWDHEFQQLMFLGKDYSECHSLCSGFVLGVGGELSVLLSDVSGNLQLFASRGGKRLVLVGDYSLGWRCTSSSILQLQPAGGGGYVTLLSGDSGTISLLIPVDESTYRRLYSLHTQLTFKLHHACGLNPKQSRSSSRSSVRNVVDADLLKEYVSLDYYQRRKLARNIGTNCAQILENLLRFDQSLTGF